MLPISMLKILKNKTSTNTQSSDGEVCGSSKIDVDSGKINKSKNSGKKKN